MPTLTLPTDLHVQVTQDDIGNGSVADCCNGDGFLVSVFNDHVSVSRLLPGDVDHLTVASLPKPAQAFVKAFDLYEDVEPPFEFDLDFSACHCHECKGGAQ